MSVSQDLSTLLSNKNSIKEAIIGKSVEVPDTELISTYAEYIDKIGSGNYDPSNPTLEGLKSALDAGDYTAFPPNTLIPDKYGDTDINWVVGHYGTATMSDGSTKEGVYLFSDKIITRQAFGTNGHYNQSTINTWLNNTFLPACSETIQNLVGEISVTGSDAAHSVNAKVWLMSAGEIMGEAPSTSNGGGVAWDAWKIRTGLSSPSTSNNTGRVMKESSGSVYYWWTRSFEFGSDVWLVYTNGSFYAAYSTNSRGIVPALFLPKGL